MNMTVRTEPSEDKKAEALMNAIDNKVTDLLYTYPEDLADGIATHDEDGVVYSDLIPKLCQFYELLPIQIQEALEPFAEMVAKETIKE